MKYSISISFVLLDINECLNGSHACNVTANCINTDGSHNCTCKEGYTGDGQSCQGILDLASYNATFKNIKGLPKIFILGNMQCDLELQTLQVEWYPKMNNIYAENRYSHGHIQSCECDTSSGYVCIELHIMCISTEMKHEEQLYSQARNCTYLSKLSLVAEIHLCRKGKSMLSLFLEQKHQEFWSTL